MDRAETSKNIQRVLRIGCIAALLALVFIGLAPQRFVPRSGFGWEIDQFVGYFVITLMLCLAWPRPVVVGVALMVFAVLLEALQAFPPDRSSNVVAALISAGGVAVAALLAEFLIQVRTGGLRSK
jgi:VanZ family protein